MHLGVGPEFSSPGEQKHGNTTSDLPRQGEMLVFFCYKTKIKMDNRTNHEEFPTQSEGYGLEIVRMIIVRMFLRESNLASLGPLLGKPGFTMSFGSYWNLRC